jgi:AP-1 complex subunit beta-1
LEIGVNYVVQEAMLVMKDIFRKFPTSYEGIIPVLCSKLESLEEPESKAALIWIIGEYAHHISNASSILEYFIRGFDDESSMVLKILK